MTVELKRVELDELELHLEILKNDFPIEINSASCKEIISLLESNFGITCTEQEMFLIHEPSIDADKLSVMLHYRACGLI